MKPFCAPLAAILMLLSFNASALDLPANSAYDHRIRTVVYNRLDVVQVDTVVGIQTHIEFEPGELYVAHAFGDPQAWTFSTKLNHIFLKPKADDADTNLTIITNRRVYNFRLSYFTERNSTKTLYSLLFDYPDTRTKEMEESAKVALVEDAFKQQRGRNNTDYDFWGDLDIAPINAWDDQEFTYIKFSPNTDMPGIYLVDADGNESLANRSAVGMAHNVYAVQKVNRLWMLRLGDRAVAVHNNSYDSQGVENTTGTKSPAVQRVLKVQ